MKQWNLDIQQRLSRQIQNNTLPHALLIVGVSGSGKQSLSKWLIDVFNCTSPSPVIDAEQVMQPCNYCKTCLLSKSATNPDTTYIATNERSISVEEVRRASQFLETKPQIAHGKSVLIAQAEKMTVSAANALLKTLEEPNNNSLIVLYCNDVDSVLPTVLSRCQLVTLRPLVGKALTAHSGMTQDDPYVNINYLAELTNDDVRQEYIKFTEIMSEVMATNSITMAFEQMILTNELGVEWLERTLVQLMRKQKQWQVAKLVNDISTSWSEKSLWQIYQLVISAKKKLKLLMQANPLFVKEQLLADIQVCMTGTEV